MDLFANLRLAKVFDALVDASSLKPEIVKGLDIMIIRELTSGVYFGEPRGRHTKAKGEVEAFDTQRFTAPEIAAVCAVASPSWRKRRQNKVLSAEKANVMHTGVLWREEATKLHKEKYADVKLEHMYADALAMQLLRSPKSFDVIVTDNLLKQTLSDEASMLTGLLGLCPRPRPRARCDRMAQGAVPCRSAARRTSPARPGEPDRRDVLYAMMLRYLPVRPRGGRPGRGRRSRNASPRGLPHR